MSQMLKSCIKIITTPVYCTASLNVRTILQTLTVTCICTVYDDEATVFSLEI